MRQLYRSTSVALAVLLGVSYVSAEDKQRDKTNNPTQAEVQTDKSEARGNKGEKLARVHRASELMGAKITNSKQEALGSVDDLVMTQDGDIKFAIIGHGGVLGIGESYIAAPWKKMKPVFGEEATFNLDISKADLERAPTFKRDNYQELQNKEWLARVHSHFKLEHDAAREKTPGTQEAADNAVRPEGDRAADKVGNERLVRASEIIGASVVNAQRETIADVNDLALDSKNCVSFAILGEGGFLSLGENLIAVPLKALNIHEMEEELVVTLDMPTEKLKQAPVLEQENLGDLNNPQYVESTRRFFNVTDDQTEVQTEAPVDQKRRENKRERDNKDN